MSLAIEVLAFANECEPGKENVLFLDEPDVRLHPDLLETVGGMCVVWLRPVTTRKMSHGYGDHDPPGRLASITDSR
jgi:hypothetical protein